MTLSRLLLAGAAARVLSLAPEGKPVSCRMDADEDEVAELFDKYNLRSLPVLDREGRVAGVIHAEQVIAGLREG